MKKYMKCIYVVIIFVFFIGCKNETKDKVVEQNNGGKSSEYLELENRTKMFVDYIVEENIDGILNLVYKSNSEDVLVESPGKYMSYNQIKEDFHSKGWLYKRFFSTEGNKLQKKEMMEMYRRDNGHEMPIEVYLSLKDIFKDAKTKNMKYDIWFSSVKTLEDVSAGSQLFWDGKNKDFLYNINFIKTEKGEWLINDLEIKFWN